MIGALTFGTQVIGTAVAALLCWVAVDEAKRIVRTRRRRQARGGYIIEPEQKQEGGDWLWPPR